MFLRVCGAMLAVTAVTISEAAARCVDFVGSQLVAVEQRGTKKGKPAELIRKETKTQPVGGGSGKWCITDHSITWTEPGIRAEYPFGGGFRTYNVKANNGFPVEIIGIATNNQGTYTINHKFTIGTKLTKGGSLRQEFSIQFSLTGGACSVRSYKQTYLMNVSGQHGDIGTYTSFTTLKPNVTCKSR